MWRDFDLKKLNIVEVEWYQVKISNSFAALETWMIWTSVVPEEVLEINQDSQRDAM